MKTTCHRLFITRDHYLGSCALGLPRMPYLVRATPKPDWWRNKITGIGHAVHHQPLAESTTDNETTTIPFLSARYLQPLPAQDMRKKSKLVWEIRICPEEA
jgi:hypothetical protein